jgi:predicted RNase H-like nuclease (RuvC/YqgF family)
MASDGGMAGWLLLSDQLSTYRFLDKLEQKRHNDELAFGDALLHRELEQVAALYNHLVAQYNDLLQRATDAANEANLQLAQMQREIDDLRQQNNERDSKIAVLRAALRDAYPDRYL